MALQERTYTYGSIDSTESRYYRTELTLKELSVSREDNTSLIEYTLVLSTGARRLSQWRTGAKIWLGGTLYAHRDGTDYDNQISIGENESLTLMAGTFTVPHGGSGKTSLSVEFSVYHPTTSNYTPGNFTYTGGEITLTGAGQETTLWATDSYIGSTALLGLSRKSTGFTHSIAYAFGEERGYLHADGTLGAEERFTETAVGFPLPEDFYYQIPRAQSGVCTLTCYTYEGDSLVGEPQTATFTVMTRERDCAPQLSATVEDINSKTLALTGNKNTLVRYASTALCTLNASARFGAEIVDSTVDGESISDNCVFTGTEKDSFTFCATDSRGYSASRVVQAGSVPYFYPTANVSAVREDPTGGAVRLTVKGIFYNGSFGQADNELSVSCRLPDGERVYLTPEISGNSYIAEEILEDFDYTRSFLLTVTVQDALTAVSATATVQKGVPVFNWDEDSFRTNVPTCLCGVNVQCGETPDGELRVYMGEYLLVAGGGVLGTVQGSGPRWQGTAGVSAAYGEDGEVVLTLPADVSSVMLLSTEGFTLY